MGFAAQKKRLMTFYHQPPANSISDRFSVRCYFDSPVIYGIRVETSNPYHLIYIENLSCFEKSIANSEEKNNGHNGEVSEGFHIFFIRN